MNSTPPSPRSIARDLFLEALEHPASRRAPFLDGACRGDDALRAAVAQLLTDHREDSFLENGVSSPTVVASSAEQPGEIIGHYKLREKIGEGGFGTVWVAEQEQPVRRRVALKIIKLGMDTKEVIARFEQERQALAMMEHPNIAKVLDAGATAAGRPFFVMELVRGVKITDYCDTQQLSTAERIGLFIAVCQAVQHAHQKGIVHRDLKPSNILVTVNDGTPVVKVIDFGVAKATQGRLTEHTVYTQFQQMVGTPLYMSPEQTDMTSLDVDTRSDIYSLGVLLYELLTGSTPIDVATMRQAGLDEMRRIIREVDPPRPSMRLKTLAGDDLTTAAKRRHVEPAKLPNALRGDLDWIVMKCLEKDRQRRYETANGLALDLRRHLQNEVITARPPTPAYLLGRLIRRHRVAVAAGTAIAASLVLGIVLSMWQAWRATDAEHEQRRLRTVAEKAAADAAASEHKAVNEAAKSAQTAQFIRSILTTFDSQGFSQNRSVMVELLTRAGARAAAELKDQPEVRVEVSETIARCYDNLGLPGFALEVARDTLDLAKKTYGTGDVHTARLMTYVAAKAVETGKMEDAEELASRGLELQRRLSGPQSKSTLEAMRVLGDALNGTGKAEEAERVFREYRALAGRTLGTEDEDSIAVEVSLARAVSALGRHDEAVTLVREAITGYERTVGPTRRRTTDAVILLCDELILQGNSAEAEALARGHLKLLHDTGVEYANSVRLDFKLARLLTGTAKDDEAGAILHETFDAARRVFRGSSPLKRQIMEELDKWYRGRGQVAEADALKDLLDAPPPPLNPSAAFLASIVDLEYKLRADNTDPGTALDLTARMAWLGRMDEWKAISREIVERAGGTTFLVTAERAAKCAAFVPGADREVLEKAALLARFALANAGDGNLSPYIRLCAGMVEYRLGNDAAADEALAMVDSKAPPRIRSTALIYRAMIALHGERRKEALSLLAGAKETMLPLPGNESAPLADGGGKDDLVAWLAWKEAQAMLNAK